MKLVFIQGKLTEKISRAYFLGIIVLFVSGYQARALSQTSIDFPLIIALYRY